MKINQKTLVVCGIILVVILGIWFGYEKIYLPELQKKEVAAHIEKYTAAQKAYYSHDFTASISSISAELKGSLTPDQKGRLDLLLAASLWSRGQGSDIEKSIQTYAAVGADASFPTLQRVAAMNSAAMEISSLGITATQYQAYLLTTPFLAYLPKTGSDYARMQDVYFHILAASDQMYPNSFAEYAIADNYYVPLLNGIEATTTSQKNLATAMQKYITQGDTKNDSALYGRDSSLPVWGNIYRALALNASAKVLGNKTLTQREAGFQLALQTAQTHLQQDNSSFSTLVLLSSFYYAAFLRTESYPAQKSKILALLDVFKGVDSTKTDVSYFANLKHKPKTDIVKSLAEELATISPAFKAFYNSVGFPQP